MPQYFSAFLESVDGLLYLAERPQRTRIIADFLPERGRVDARDHVDEVGGGRHGVVLLLDGAAGDVCFRHDDVLLKIM